MDTTISEYLDARAWIAISNRSENRVKLMTPFSLTCLAEIIPTSSRSRPKYDVNPLSLAPGTPSDLPSSHPRIRGFFWKIKKKKKKEKGREREREKFRDRGIKIFIAGMERYAIEDFYESGEPRGRFEVSSFIPFARFPAQVSRIA